jgi:glycosyltransferase involved in cell wall biosynthesis
MPLISFVIQFFNRYGLVRQAVESVLSSTSEDIELILIDDASCEQGLDDLVSYFKEKNNIIYIRQEKQKGPGLARNRGISLSRGGWIFFMDSDDMIAHEALDKFCRFLREQATPDFIALTKVILCWPDGKTEYKNNGNTSVEGIVDNFFSKISGYGSLWNYCFRKRFIIAHGIRCPESFMDEDTCFLLSSYCYATNISFYNDDFYIHNENTPLSLSTLSRDFNFKSRKILQARTEFFMHILDLVQTDISKAKTKLMKKLLSKHILCAYWDNKCIEDFASNDIVVEIVNQLHTTIYRYTCLSRKNVYISPCFIDALGALKLLSECKVNVLGFIDNNPDSPRAVACKKAFGLGVYSIDEIKPNENSIIFIFGRHSDMISRQYKDMGLIDGEDYFNTGLL